VNDMDTVLKAIAQVESSGGGNNYPRFERSFAPAGLVVIVQGRTIQCTGHNFSQVAKDRYTRWGMASACSFGPWQMLYHTAADHGFKGAPWEMWGTQVVEPLVRAELLRRFKQGADTITKIADAWNSGSFTDVNIPGDYIQKVTAAFKAFGGDPAAPLVF